MMHWGTLLLVTSNLRSTAKYFTVASWTIADSRYKFVKDSYTLRLSALMTATYRWMAATLCGWPVSCRRDKAESPHTRESFRKDSFREDSFREYPRRALGFAAHCTGTRALPRRQGGPASGGTPQTNSENLKKNVVTARLSFLIKE